MNREEVPEQVDKEASALSTPPQAFFNFVNAMIGIGVISLPYVSQRIGWLWSIIMLMPVLFCVTRFILISPLFFRSNLFLIEVADNLQAKGLLYSDLARIIYGGYFPYIVNGALVLLQIGACTAYLLFFTYFLQIEVERYGFELHKIYYFLMSLIIIWPLTMIKNMHFFNKASLLSFVLGIFCLVSIILEAFYQYLFMGAEIKYQKAVDVRATFSYIGIAIFCFEGIQTLLPIRDSMRDRFKFINVFLAVVIVAFSIALLVQQSTVLIFGEEVKQLVIFNFHNEQIRTFITLCYLLSLILTYPLQLLVAIQIVELELDEKPYSQIKDTEIENLDVEGTETQMFIGDWQSLIVRIVFTAIIYGVAYFIPDFSAFLNLIGVVLGSLIQYVFPVMFHMKRFWHLRPNRPIFSYVFILFVSVLAIVLGSYNSIRDMMNAENEE